MNQSKEGVAKILVVIASYGSANDRYLAEVIRKYQSMSFLVDVVIHSNTGKTSMPGVEVIVGVPTRDAMSLPFASRKTFAQRVNDYDLFIYTEDDILITEDNVRAFLKLSGFVSNDEIVGMFRFEVSPAGKKYYPDVHRRFRWDASSVRNVEEYCFAYFSNEHSGCYILTQKQLRRAIVSGGFVVPPHRGKYTMLETAATDVYTQCGFRKVICISHLEEFLVRHLPDKYLDKQGTPADMVHLQIGVLRSGRAEGGRMSSLLDTGAEMTGWPWAKNYYEEVRDDLIALVPGDAKTVLSLGCGSGLTEEALGKTGRSVTAVPVDRVIAACVTARNVPVVTGNFSDALDALGGRTFDCVLISNLLHLVEDPVKRLVAVKRVVREGASVIVAVPNLFSVQVLWRWMRREPYYRKLRDFAETGVHFTSQSGVRRWFKRSGLHVTTMRCVVPNTNRLRCARRSTLGLCDSVLASEIVAVAVKTRGA
jgi:SAM-dependent methyltransferase